jgi:hypothetical protein
MAGPVNKGQVVASAWEDYVAQDPADQIYQYFWLLENLRVGDSFKKGAGDPITGTIEYALNTTVKSMSELETLDVVRVDVFDRYEYAWKLMGGLIVMSDFERGQTAGAAGKFDLEAAKMESLKNSMQSQINTDLFSDGTGNAGKQAGGLQYIVSSTPTVGTVGAINRVTYSFWRNQQASGAKSATLYDNVKSGLRSIYNLCSSGVAMQTPDFAVTDRATFEGYESLSVTIERLNRSSATDKLISGFAGDHIMFKDIPIAFDFAAPVGNIYVLNRRNLFIRWMFWMKASPAVNPANQFADVIKILSVYNLCSDNPRRLGVLTACNT